ncbi:MAG TPA: hypothetical protein VKG21_03305 [Casimicrobiaceae bacterium]|nr:hypothetical protein [Casimicrobiaceae bacterium]
MTTSSEKRLIEELGRVRRLHDTRQRTPELAAVQDRLARWQARRLNATYADLARDPRYTQAIAFFGSDLYGPGDFSRRDAELARVVPIMVRMLPDAVVATVAMAMELSALSQELDRTLLRELGEDTLSVPTYCAAYRACANRPARKRQIALIVDVGRALDRYVHKAFLRQTLRLMRGPAKVAGLSALQDFLERGFTSFAGMRGADQFLAIIKARETALMDAIFAGDRAPFPDPLA